MKIVKEIRKGRKIIFDKGKFDDWCVYVVEEDGSKRAPFDVEYFTDLKRLNQKYGNNKVYNDFLSIYHPTGKNVDPIILAEIEQIVETYEADDQELIEQWFTVIYAGMVAEENKANAILKKRIKHLGVHQTLIQDFEPAVSAKYSFGKKWRELDAVMKTFQI